MDKATVLTWAKEAQRMIYIPRNEKTILSQGVSSIAESEDETLSALIGASAQAKNQ